MRPNLANCLAFQSVDYEHIWWRLFKKRVVRIKLDSYDFITKHVPIMCLYVLRSVLWSPLRFRIKWFSVRLYLQLSVRGVMSYLRYLCLFAYSDVQHILCCVFALFSFVSCTLCCEFLWLVHFWLPLRYSLTFIRQQDNSTLLIHHTDRILNQNPKKY